MTLREIKASEVRAGDRVRLVVLQGVSYHGLQGALVVRGGPKNVRLKACVQFRPNGPFYESEHVVPRDRVSHVLRDGVTYKVV